MEKADTPGVLVTVTPWRAAAARSTLSVPVPHNDNSRRSAKRWKMLSLKRVDERMLITIPAPAMRSIRLSSLPGSVS